MELDDRTIGIVGLGYVGLPLAAEFARRRPVLGFDRDPARIAALRAGFDATGEVEAGDLSALHETLRFSHDPADLAACGIFIVCVPTPVDAAKRPDLGPLIAACETVGRAMGEGAVVVFESTVYPGCTEEVCVPILERLSGLAFNEGFFCGYSPERVNPGDRRHRIPDIVKVTSGSTPQAAEAIDRLYAAIVPAGTHRAASIRVAEAAKVIENTQRDLNIALMNELALIFHRLGIDTVEVLEAAGTKWNFLPFRPGLVGGHCIGVDPYYLTHKAQEVGYYPEVILSGRRINDGVGAHVADRVVKLMLERRIAAFEARVLVLGLAFKENCRDTRNSRVVDTVRALEGFHAAVEVFDPCVDAADAAARYGLTMRESLAGAGLYDGVVLAVAHDEFRAMGAAGIRALLKPGGVLFDVKAMLPLSQSDGRL
ncbi:nucleotide sugar dehydrogenase [Aurantimonas sp. Leaf443]|uniref:nucleotide sugar dehydrogenase n=1 Tax=Aurantimonas sp. Leaf443 TaxID=1736378 RepID=UPI0006F58841|nr:nucleotide sugar dehydrogenase [Aurantimonas sp. Leaf443]KQT88318.1 Vi polysaccharide biosynthesis protein VipA/TviB [Aurantimonas sp. Leaf443]